MTVEAIKDAIMHLSEADREQLAEWFDEMEEDEWDRQMETDFAPDGRGAHLLQQLNREIDAGNFSPLEDGLRRRQDQRAKK